jgi:hypothetical protein
MAKDTKRAKDAKEGEKGAGPARPAKGVDADERPVLEIMGMVPQDASTMTTEEIHAMVLHDMDKEGEHEAELKRTEFLIPARLSADLAQGLARLEDRYMHELKINSGDQIALVHFGQHHPMTAVAAPSGAEGIELSPEDLDMLGISHGDTIIVRRREE